MANSKPRWRTYVDEDKKRQVFRVFITHGQSNLWKEVKHYIESELGFATEVLVDRFQGAVIFDKLEEAAWYCECAVVIATADDPQGPGKPPRARQNVVHEIGYLQGLFRDAELVVILKEMSIEWFTNVQGIEYIPFEGKLSKSTLATLGAALESIYRYYKDE